MLELRVYKSRDFSLFGANYWGILSGNTYAVYPGTCRSRGPCDRLTVTACTVCVLYGANCTRAAAGEHRVVTPGHAASARPVTETFSPVR